MRARPRPAGLRVLAKKQGNTGDHSHAVSKRRKRESVRTAARSAQSATVLAQELLAARVERIAAKLIELAEGGDMRAIRVCMDRLMPAIKHQPIAVELPPIETAADSVEASASIVAAVATGELTATEAAELAKVIDTYVGALASRGFEERLTKLENGN
jgi:F0F1-type ATP synthase gamma subunit